MKRVPIKSSANPEDPRPWFEMLLADGSPEVELLAANGLLAFREHMADIGKRPFPAEERERVMKNETAAARRKYPTRLATGPRPQGSPKPEESRPNLRDEVHVLAMTMDGEVEFVPSSQQRHEYYAHLAWYDPLTSEWTALEFGDDDEQGDDDEPGVE